MAGNGWGSLTAESSPWLMTSIKIGISVLLSPGTEFC